MQYSGPFRRIAAFFIDLLVMLVIYMALGLLFSLFTAILLTFAMIGLWFYGGMFLLSWLYFSSLESSRYQATIGKKLLGLRVATTDGRRIGFFRASVRYLGKFLSRITLMIGFLMIPFTKKKQGLHDKLAKTVVIIQR